MNTFDYFKQICQIPRESGNEEGMRKYLLTWAKENNFKALQDRSGNIIVYCDATDGFENVSPVVLQGHMDMVCVKTPDSKHDFTKDPIEVYEDGDFLRAKDTSLGGDNGIAVAMTMALLTDKSAKHGPIEALFTFSEETGMDGAFNLDASLIKSRKLINLDSEEEGIIYIGCAGGVDITSSYKASLEEVPESWEPVEIKVGGLKGGHSGGEIHHQRLNAIWALSRMLCAIENSGKSFMLCEFDGGVRRNVIPSSASCKICIPSDSKKEIMTSVLSEFDLIKEEFKFQDSDFFNEHHCSKCNADVTKPNKALSASDSKKIIKALFTCPHGVSAMSQAVKGIVETSDNIAIAKLDKDVMNVEISVRSLIDSAKYSLAYRIRNILESLGYEVNIGGSYPSWSPNPDSKLATFCAKAWKDSTGKDAVVTSIHAGLECGVINSLIEGMDSVSIGPDLFDVHSVNEHLSISSTKRMYDFVKHLLSIIK